MKVFVTHKISDPLYCGRIEAETWEEAYQKAESKGEIVDGILNAESNEDFTEWRDYSDEEPNQTS